VEWDYIDEAREAWNNEVLEMATVEENEHEEWEHSSAENEDDYWYQDTARDCIGWEEDMKRRGSPY
jgi:hypothetical protein